jgi:hypothetical protein
MPNYNSFAISGLGGTLSALNVNAAGVVATGKRTLFRIVVQVAPSAGSLTINDLAANSGAAISNQVMSIASGASLVAGQVITVDWPFSNGIVFSSVGTGGVYAIAYS